MDSWAQGAATSWTIIGGQPCGCVEGRPEKKNWDNSPSFPSLSFLPSYLLSAFFPFLSCPFFSSPSLPLTSSISHSFLLLNRQCAQFSSVQSLSHVQLLATAWTAARQASLSITNSQGLLKLMSIELVMPSDHLILCRPPFLPPLIFPSIRVFSNESVLCIRWPKYWSFSFSISSSNEYSGLISSRMDWLDLLVVQGTLKSLLQHHSSKASILRRSAFFIVQLSHSYMSTGKTIALTRQTLVGKVMSLQCTHMVLNKKL